MLRVAVAVLALVAVAYGIAPVCNETVACFKLNEPGCTGVSPSYTPFCAQGTHCTSSGICARDPQLGETCSPTTDRCFGNDFTPSCDVNKCKWVGIYGPGDACSTDTNIFTNGGCRADLTCTAGKCSALAAGALCNASIAAANQCPAGQFCNNGVNGDNRCTKRLGSGANCTGNFQCDETLICSNRGTTGTLLTCQQAFIRTSGQSCQNSLDCAANTGCLAGTCTAKGKSVSSCDTDISACSNWFGCVCGASKHGRNITDKHPAKCEDLTDGVFGGLNDWVTSGIIKAYNSMQTCVQKNACHDAWSMQHNLLTSGPNQCIAKCFKSAFTTGYEKQGNKYNSCSASGSNILVPALFAVLLALAALFAY